MKTMLLLFAATLCLAQDAVQKYYKFDFVVKELDAGKVQSARTYSAIGGARGRENSIMIRAGEKVQVPTVAPASRSNAIHLPRYRHQYRLPDYQSGGRRPESRDFPIQADISGIGADAAARAR